MSEISEMTIRAGLAGPKIGRSDQSRHDVPAFADLFPGFQMAASNAGIEPEDAVRIPGNDLRVSLAIVLEVAGGDDCWAVSNQRRNRSETKLAATRWFECQFDRPAMPGG